MPAPFKFTTTPFADGDSMHRDFTCEGSNVSPALEWNGVPDGTKSQTLILEDPDAPRRTFTHWVLFNVPGDTTRLPRGLDVKTAFPKSDPAPREGRNDFGNVGYGGPCPPPGDGPHRYIFRLFAVDTTLELDEGVSNDAVMQAMDGHILAEAERTGTYER
ncbi:YbhB/YbcL family Raf kinase inhibitor-like protein [Longibacter salinarum]|uniref:YbhB/YbcL family Raf kinase inhibitor-like protein n=1 Tax=Longibacter salinarum TaxID=1850348 RepID=A0A2A8D251_9BACT|nr:YbhB/YbcL family Raf kinase inhibitor-like protein [Longibacter salinarum]PEN14961.1 YbhB/YbcL family Raf kinase inhibitor-like protein [Longibacter salinarum]